MNHNSPGFGFAFILLQLQVIIVDKYFFENTLMIKLHIMKYIFKNSHIKAIASIILFVLVFSFAHSELEQFSSFCNSHESHDYCRIVEKATNQTSRTITVNSVKISCDEDICPHCFNEYFPSLNNNSLNRYITFCGIPENTEIYLKNNSILI